MIKKPQVKGIRRGVYLLPSLFTVGNMILGFYAIILGLRGEFQIAILLVFAAAFFDGIDGRIARLSGTDSDFGKEYDSLADLLTFGVAPALLLYLWGLEDFGRIGWMVPLAFVVAAATRLARFNASDAVIDRRYFVGLPAPAAAGGVGSILFFADVGGYGRAAAVVLLIALIFFGLLMVSGFRYYTFKELDPRRRWPVRIVLLIAALLLLVAFHPAAFFLVVSGSYALSGPSQYFRGQLRARFGRHSPAETESETEEQA